MLINFDFKRLSQYVRQGWLFSVRFGFYQKKVTKPNFFKKTKTGSNRLVSVRFFWTKTGSTRFGLVFSVWLVFFFQFGFGSVRFFQFQTCKTKIEPVGFFKILIGFFHGSVFSVIFFSGFLGFLVFLLTPNVRSAFFNCKYNS